MHTSKRINSCKKLLKTKWTAVVPVNKEKHFIVTKLLMPELPESPITHIEIEAVHSKRVQQLAWQALNDTNQWLQGWV